MSEAFADTIHCRSHAHCRTCRDLDGGRPWRTSMATRFAVPGGEPDWRCPEGLPWHLSRAKSRDGNKNDVPASQSESAQNNLPPEVQPAARKPCGCGKNRRVVDGATSIETEGGAPNPVTDVPPPTRPSCLECVEKHLGAAWVLITEHRNSYPHRLLAIGHLHEAEDESQAWPALHAAIRAARKQYQISCQMPEWTSLARLLEIIWRTAR